MSKDQGKRVQVEELTRELAEELTPEEAEEAEGGLGSLSRVLMPMPPPIEPTVIGLQPTPPPI
jgi:hypothetical protein